MELKDTVSMMCSDDYKERFKAEYYQLKIRYDKLSNIINDYNFNNNIDILITQHRCMYTLLHILEERARIEKIEL